MENFNQLIKKREKTKQIVPSAANVDLVFLDNLYFIIVSSGVTP